MNRQTRSIATTLLFWVGVAKFLGAMVLEGSRHAGEH